MICNARGARDLMPLHLGQEAVAVGSAIQANDVLLPGYRDNAAPLWRGVTMENTLLFWGGDERGSHRAGPVQDFPFCIPVGSKAPHRLRLQISQATTRSGLHAW